MAYSQFASMSPSSPFYVSVAANVNQAYANYRLTLCDFRLSLELSLSDRYLERIGITNEQA